MHCRDPHSVEPHYEDLLERVGAKRSGGGWDGCCPISDRHKNGDRKPSLRLWLGERGELVCRCYGCGAKWSEVMGALGTSARDWWPSDTWATPGQQQRRRAVSKVVARHEYRDAGGALVAVKLRKEPGAGGARKSFSWARPLPPELRAKYQIGPDEPAWVWGSCPGPYAPHKGDPRDWRIQAGVWGDGAVPFPALAAPLYHLPDLLALPEERPVAVVEGEMKADLLARLGLCAVCGPHGASAWDHGNSELFRGRRAIVFPDNDGPGLRHASAVVGSLVSAGAAAVKLILPGPEWELGEGEDVADWLARVPERERKSRLAELVRSFPAYSRGGK